MSSPTFPQPVAFFPRWVMVRQSGLLEWLDRQRQRAQLARLDDRMLEDIGVKRDAAEEESNLWT